MKFFPFHLYDCETSCNPLTFCFLGRAFYGNCKTPFYCKVRFCHPKDKHEISCKLFCAHLGKWLCVSCWKALGERTGKGRRGEGRSWKTAVPSSIAGRVHYLSALADIMQLYQSQWRCPQVPFSDTLQWRSSETCRKPGNASDGCGWCVEVPASIQLSKHKCLVSFEFLSVASKTVLVVDFSITVQLPTEQQKLCDCPLEPWSGGYAQQFCTYCLLSQLHRNACQE